MNAMDGEAVRAIAEWSWRIVGAIASMFLVFVAGTVGVVRWIFAIKSEISNKVDRAVYDADQVRLTNELTHKLELMEAKGDAREKYIHAMKHDMDGNLQTMSIALWMIAEKLQIRLPPSIKRKIDEFEE